MSDRVKNVEIDSGPREESQTLDDLITAWDEFARGHPSLPMAGDIRTAFVERAYARQRDQIWKTWDELLGHIAGSRYLLRLERNSSGSLFDISLQKLIVQKATRDRILSGMFETWGDDPASDEPTVAEPELTGASLTAPESREESPLEVYKRVSGTRPGNLGLDLIQQLVPADMVSEWEEEVTLWRETPHWNARNIKDMVSAFRRKYMSGKDPQQRGGAAVRTAELSHYDFLRSCGYSHAQAQQLLGKDNPGDQAGSRPLEPFRPDGDGS